jgi:hypothetical protein
MVLQMDKLAIPELLEPVRDMLRHDMCMDIEGFHV